MLDLIAVSETGLPGLKTRPPPEDAPPEDLHLKTQHVSGC